MSTTSTSEALSNLCGCNLSTILLGFFGSSLLVYLYTSRRPNGIPPGPKWTLPIIGDLLLLDARKENGDVRLPVRRLRKQYGDIFSLYMGPKLAIFINGYNLIREALVKNGDVFSHRPKLFIDEFISEGKGIVFTSGTHWKEQRKFALETLREFGFGKSVMEDRIHEELEMFIKEINSYSGQAMDFNKIIQAAVSNVTVALIFGHRYEYDEPAFVTFLDKLQENFTLLGGSNVLNFMPILRFLPGDMFHVKKILENVDVAENTVFKPAIEERLKNFDENNTNDFISCYIKEMKKHENTGEETSFTQETLISTIGDLFAAGTETTSTTLTWAILYCLHHPEVYQKCFTEIQKVIGSGRLPSMKDKANMPYVHAVILETQRLSNIAVWNVPHSVNEDIYFNGYFFPKDCIVFPNLDSCLGDDDVWGDADNFRPERFLDSSGEVIKKEELLPFSLGRRACLGESLAKMELFLFFVTFIQRYDLQPEDKTTIPSLTGIFGFSHSAEKYQIKALPR